MAHIHLAHVSKRYGEVAAVTDLSLEIADGEFLYLIGPSGCGKTTALRLIAGLEVPDEGDVLFDGKVVNDVRPAKRDVAMVFEDFALYPHLKVRDNLAFPLRMRKTPAEAIRRRVAEVAERSELQPVLGRKPGGLATGEAQHVAIGHAVVRETTSAFLLDDALAHLDAHQRLEARAELARLHRELGATLVAVTHDQAEALAVATRVAVMDDGRLRQVATPRELYEHPADTFVAGFIGSPGMNLVEMTVATDDGMGVDRPGARSLRLPAGREVPSLRPGEPVIVGFRPEHVHLHEAGRDEIGFDGTSDLVEYLGDRRLVHIDADGVPIVASVPPGSSPSPGEHISCSVSYERLHFFDPTSGRAQTI
jgi:multiple sugar transport system ATP-binding protein